MDICSGATLKDIQDDYGVEDLTQEVVDEIVKYGKDHKLPLPVEVGIPLSSGNIDSASYNKLKI